jgi:GT2 family glycosyltransferase
MQALASHGLVICTYRRRDRITQLLRHFILLKSLPAHIVIVNGQKPGEKPDFPDVELLRKSGVHFQLISCPPSTPLQRAEGLSCLPPEVSIVHFIDDDFLPEPDYFTALAQVFESKPDIAGAGGLFTQPVATFSHPKWRRLFGLDGARPGAILPTGYTTLGQVNIVGKTEPFQVDWLSGCSMSFRRSILEKVTFPSELEGYAMDEDLIISAQAGQHGSLLAVPAARGRHESEKELRSDKQWFFYSIAARHHAVKFYLTNKTSLTKFWTATVIRLLWRLWKNKFRPMRLPAFGYNFVKLLTLNNAPKMDTFRAN